MYITASFVLCLTSCCQFHSRHKALFVCCNAKRQQPIKNSVTCLCSTYCFNKCGLTVRCSIPVFKITTLIKSVSVTNANIYFST